ncbi:MAG: metallophosphoesterase [Verrucomicrobia bacterium]|nr:metallophosphoesterase [Verrucomicrobiota bacterium]
MKYGIFGDVHGNLEALEAVLADMEDQQVTHPLCIGDLVGYNANPAECVEVVRALGCPVVRGNHDELVTQNKNPETFSKDAQVALAFSREHLIPAQLNYLRRLPLVHVEEAFTLVHATLDGPENWAYISTQLEAQTSFFYQKTHLCFIGHTHRPAAFLKEEEVRPIEFRKVDVHPERPGNFCLTSVLSANPGMGIGVPVTPSTIRRTRRLISVGSGMRWRKPHRKS